MPEFEVKGEVSLAAGSERGMLLSGDGAGTGISGVSPLIDASEVKKMSQRRGGN